MRFEPKSFYQGENIARIASALALLVFFGGLFFFFKNKETLANGEQLTDIEPDEQGPVKTTPAPPPAARPKGKK
jgi:hypothetical protein